MGFVEIGDAAIIESLARKYDCETKGKDLTKGLDEVKVKNADAVQTLDTDCEAAYKDYNQDLAAGQQEATKVERSAKPNATKAHTKTVNTADANYGKIETKHNTLFNAADKKGKQTQQEWQKASTTAEAASSELVITNREVDAQRKQGTSIHTGRMERINSREASRIDASKKRKTSIFT